MNPRQRVERLVLGSTPAQLAEARRLLGGGEPSPEPTRLILTPRTCGRCGISYSRGGASLSMSFHPPASVYVAGIDACGPCAEGILRAFGRR